MALKKLKIKSYKLERGHYYVINNGQSDYESWHRIFLKTHVSFTSGSKDVEIEFATDAYLSNYFSKGLGHVSDIDNKMLVRYRLSDFDQIYDILRSESPLYIEYDEFPSNEGPPDRMRIHTLRFTSNEENTGEGPRDFGDGDGLL